MTQTSAESYDTAVSLYTLWLPPFRIHLIEQFGMWIAKTKGSTDERYLPSFSSFHRKYALYPLFSLFHCCDQSWPHPSHSNFSSFHRKYALHPLFSLFHCCDQSWPHPSHSNWKLHYCSCVSFWSHEYDGCVLLSSLFNHRDSTPFTIITFQLSITARLTNNAVAIRFSIDEFNGRPHLSTLPTVLQSRCLQCNVVHFKHSSSSLYAILRLSINRRNGAILLDGRFLSSTCHSSTFRLSK